MADVTIAGLSAALAAALGENTIFEIQDPDISAPQSRKLVITQLRSLIARGTAVRIFQGGAKVGTTAGWVVNAANNLGKVATIPASQTSATLVIPITGLKVGDVISQYSLVGSLQSAGNNCTITSDFRVLLANAAGAVDSSIASQALPLTVTANTVLINTNNGHVGFTHTVADGESFYVLVTATTAASCTGEIQAVRLTTAGS